MKITTFLLALLPLFAAPAFSAEAREAKPNVLLFLVDDMGLMDTSVPFLADQEGRPKSNLKLRREMIKAMEKSLEEAGAQYPALGGKSLKPSR